VGYQWSKCGCCGAGSCAINVWVTCFADYYPGVVVTVYDQLSGVVVGTCTTGPGFSGYCHFSVPCGRQHRVELVDPSEFAEPFAFPVPPQEPGPAADYTIEICDGPPLPDECDPCPEVERPDDPYVIDPFGNEISLAGGVGCRMYNAGLTLAIDYLTMGKFTGGSPAGCYAGCAITPGSVPVFYSMVGCNGLILSAPVAYYWQANKDFTCGEDCTHEIESCHSATFFYNQFNADPWQVPNRHKLLISGLTCDSGLDQPPRPWAGSQACPNGLPSLVFDYEDPFGPYSGPAVICKNLQAASGVTDGFSCGPPLAFRVPISFGVDEGGQLTPDPGFAGASGGVGCARFVGGAGSASPLAQIFGGNATFYVVPN
jgi:hypothetical protein